MKYLMTLTLLAGLPLLLPATASNPIRFLENSPSEVQQMAAREGKLYFIHFAANWCMTSQWMEEQTFTDATLAAFLEKHFLALRADVDLPEGQALQAQYGVDILPSLLVFSAQGRLLGRHEGAMEPEALLEELKAYPRLAGPRPAAEKDILPSPRAAFNLSRPALIPDVEEDKPERIPAVSYAHAYPTPAARPVNRPVTPPPAASFTIQAGVFSSYGNAIRYCARLENRMDQRAEITPCRLNGQERYKVFLGRFTTQVEASALLQQLRRRGLEGFVKMVE